MEANSTSPDELNGMLVIKKGAKATYLWFTDDGGKAFDTHGDGPRTNDHGYARADRCERQVCWDRSATFSIGSVTPAPIDLGSFPFRRSGTSHTATIPPIAGLDRLLKKL